MSENFVSAASLSDVPPGKMYRADINGKRILLANVDGTVYAVDDTCTHEDASLATGALKGDCVKCPLHGSRFKLATGEPLDEPADEALRTYVVRVEGDHVLVDID